MTPADRIPVTDERVPASVLAMDIVSYSREFDEHQERLVDGLGQVIQQVSAEFGIDDLIGLPTGDGAFLVFPGRTSSTALSFGLRVHTRLHESLRTIPLRMGVHEGAVKVVTDLNGHRNAIGAAINLAQRVMDVGDAGHVVVSEAAAATLMSSERFREHLTPLRDQPVEVKHGVRLGLFLYREGVIGSWNLPAKLRQQIGISAATMGRHVDWPQLLDGREWIKMIDLSMPLFGVPAMLDELERLVGSGVRVEVLLLNPLSALTRLRRVSVAYDTAGELETTLEYVINILLGFRRRLESRLSRDSVQRFEVRLFNSMPGMSAFLTETGGYVSPYMEHLSGSRGPCLKVSADSPIYDCAATAFDALWSRRSISLFSPSLQEELQILLDDDRSLSNSLSIPAYLIKELA